MTTETERPSESGDDCDCNPFTATISGSTVTVDGLGGGLRAAFRFPNVDIAKEQTLDSANLNLRTLSYTCAPSGNCNTTVYGIAEDNVSTFSGSNNPYAKAVTSASTAWNLTANQSVNGHGSHDIDVLSQCQEIIDRSGWSSGNALGIKIVPGTFGKFNKINIDAWDGIQSLRATLTIEYTVATTGQKRRLILGVGI